MICMCNKLAIRIEHHKRINGSRRSDLVRNRINDLDEIKKKLHAMRACSIIPTIILQWKSSAIIED